MINNNNDINMLGIAFKVCMHFLKIVIIEFKIKFNKFLVINYENLKTCKVVYLDKKID